MKNNSAGKAIDELSRAGQIYLQHEFSKYNIGHAQVKTLLYLAENKDKTQKELVQYLNLDKSSITSQLQILEKNGYIIRQTSKVDARKQVVNITDKANKKLPELKIIFASWTNTLLAGFSEEERSDIFKYLERMRENVNDKLSGIQLHTLIIKNE